MPAPSGDAFIESLPLRQIEVLADLYDRFAHALDPYSEQADGAEEAFEQEVFIWHDKAS